MFAGAAEGGHGGKGGLSGSQQTSNSGEPNEGVGKEGLKDHHIG